MNSFDVTIEIPGGSRNKYEVDHETGRIRLDRHLFTAMVYPADYGFIADTLGEDGDPLDALVLLDEHVYPGVDVKARAVGVFQMADEGGPDAKIISVPDTDPRWSAIRDIDDVPAHTRAVIEHFFRHYKDLEPGKFVTIDGWADAAEAEKIIAAAFRRIKQPKGV
ncbi:inorganic diphosphatase [Parafrigoribacterium mesophilum]|uniref:inorganic diphosphatase n=1 Tax=Parafrigoribacterium mesophilum TaxID=433646 RepID=UPI0031FC8394